MRNLIIIFSAIFLISGCSNPNNDINSLYNTSPNSITNKRTMDKNLQISSAFKDGKNIPSIYSCKGNNVNPPLKIMGLQEETKTIAVIVDDSDAPNGDWVHWVAWNIKSDNIEENSSGKGNFEEGINSGDIKGYDGPCPPRGHGIHHYHFKVYALNKTLILSESTKKQDLEKAMNGNIIGFGEITGLYEIK